MKRVFAVLVLAMFFLSGCLGAIDNVSDDDFDLIELQGLLRNPDEVDEFLKRGDDDPVAFNDVQEDDENRKCIDCGKSF